MIDVAFEGYSEIGTQYPYHLVPQKTIKSLREAASASLVGTWGFSNRVHILTTRSHLSLSGSWNAFLL